MELEGEEEDIELTWKKTERELRTTGMREGLSDGKDSTFQSSFDDGYQDGFRNGFAMGKYCAALQFSSRGDISKDEALLAKPSQGWCQMCSNPEPTKSLSDIVKEQSDSANNNLKNLSEKYSEDVRIPVPKSSSDT